MSSSERISADDQASSPRLLTTLQAAAYLCVSVRTVRNLMSDGKLHYVKIGRATRIDSTDLGVFVAQNRRKRRNPARTIRPS
jgi:excisionase family DNA binding protein